MILRRLFVWILSFTVSVMNSQSMSQQYYNFDNIGRVTQKLCIRGIAQSSNGMIWLAAESGLYSYDGYHLIQRPVDEAIVGKKSLGSFNCLLASGDSLFIGCNEGVLSFNLNTYSFRLLSYARGETVKSMVRTDSAIWVATERAVYKNGIKLDPSPDNIISLYSDDSFLYMGTMNAVYRYSINKQQLEKMMDGMLYATCFYFDKQNDLLWVGTAASISVWKNKTGTLVSTIPMPVTKSICVDKLGNMLIGTDNGLYIVEKNMEIKTIFHDARRENSLAGDAIWSIFRDQSNNIWIGTNSGVSVVQGEGFMTTFPLPLITGEGAGNQFFCTYRDSKGRIWLGGSNGLLCIEQLGKDSQTYRWYRMNDPRFPILHNRIRDIMEDSEGDIYIGGDMGLMRYDDATRQFQRYVIEEDPNNWVYAIRELSNKEFNITTYSATYIATFDKASRHVVVNKITQREDLSSRNKNERLLLEKYGLTENYFTASYDPGTGTVLLGGTDLFSVLDTEKLNRDRKNRSLTITDIRINDDRYIDHGNILQNDVVLLPEDRIIEVMFSDFNYTGGLTQGYFYRIDKGEWLPVHSKNNSIILTNLNTGTHSLSIRYADDTKAAAMMQLTVRAPWYATTLAKIIYLLLLLCLISGIYYTVKQRKRAQTERLMQQSLLLKAKQKEKELLNDNEYLTAQLRLQLQAKVGEDGMLSENEKFLLKITKIIEENMSDSDLNINMLCEYSGISSKQLYRKIKAMTGMTTVAYIRNQRLMKAATLLAKGTFTVSEVMYMVGFSNPSYFTRCFTEEFKTAPSEYKK
ncbi:MAG: two-component regulator propeller domain-containing protein [Bacteroidales bacterium]|nr:two-component regulator propeller domain-containing protein [Bacteroidales bacterium]